MLYLSYHNSNLSTVINFTKHLEISNYALWFDRHQISFSDNWSRSIVNAIQTSDYALVFLSKPYISSKYCIDELGLLSESDIPMIGLAIGDMSLSALNNLPAFVEVFDDTEDHDYKRLMYSLGELRSQTTTEIIKAKPSERMGYIRHMLNRLEMLLAYTTTRQEVRLSARDQYNEVFIRPRGYSASLLIEGAYSLLIDDEVLALEDLVSLFKVQSKIVMSGDSGTGKSTIGQLVGLWAVHRYRINQNAPRPLYLNLSNWQLEQTFDEFIQDEWYFAHDWRSWLEQNSAFFVVDVDTASAENHPNYIEQMASLCLLVDHHHCLFIVPRADLNEAVSNYSVAVVETMGLSNRQIFHLGQAFLAERQLVQLNSFYEQVSSKSHHRHLGYVSSIVELLNSHLGNEQASMSQHLAAKTIYLRWLVITEHVDIPISFEEFLSALKFLAWTLQLSDQVYFIGGDDALNLIGDSAIIDLAIDMGILSVVGDKLRFVAWNIQAELAAYHLVADGIYKYLPKPLFGEDGHRIPSKWDQVVTLSYSIIEPEQQDDIIELVDDIDPFLALAFAQQDQQLLKKYLYQLLQKLLDIHRKKPESQPALFKAVADISDVVTSVECLVRLVRASKPESWQIIQDLLRQLRVIVPDDIQQEVRYLERDFSDSRVALLGQYPISLWIAYLSSLVLHSDRGIQRNAICLLGDTHDYMALPTLFSLLNNDSKAIFRDTLGAIAKIICQQDIALFIEQLPDVSDDYDAVADVFRTLDRSVSGMLIQYLHSSEVVVEKELLQLLSGLSEQAVIEIVIKALSDRSIDLQVGKTDPFEGENAMKLAKALQRRFQNIRDKASLEQFWADVKQVSSDDNQENGDVSAQVQSIIQQRLQDSQDVSSVSKQSDVPEVLLTELSAEDWMRRYRAVQELTSYPADTILSYVIDAAEKDEDVQIRIAALDILASLSHYENAIETLIFALENEDHQIIDTATDHLNQIEGVETGVIVSLLGHENVQTVAAAIEILTKHHNLDAVKPLIDLLKDERQPWLSEKTLGHYAAIALIQLGEIEGIEAVRASGYIEEPEPQDVILPAIEHDKKRKHYSSEQKIQLTLIALRGDDWELSQKAARYLRDLALSLQNKKSPKIIHQLEAALQDDIWTVRWAVVEALAWIKSFGSVPKIVMLLSDDNWMIKVAAIRSLVELDAKETASEISRLLTGNHSAVCEAAAEALGTLQNPIALEELRSALGASDEFVRLSAIKSIHQILEDKAQPYLLSVLNDPYSHIRWYAIKQLSELASAEALPTIVNLLPDETGPAWEEYTISDYALITLRHINTRESQAVIDQWFMDRN